MPQPTSEVYQYFKKEGLLNYDRFLENDEFDEEEFEKMMRGIPYGLMGCLNAKKEFHIYGLDGKICIAADIAVLKEAWQEPLRW